MPDVAKGKRLGQWGEEEACKFLVRQGFIIKDRNYHATVGEIDIVAAKGDDFYFVEVKTRYAGPMEYDTAITGGKKYKMQKTIANYCSRRNIRDAGLVPTSLMVIVDKFKKTASFRLAVMYL